jgi:hypothetical protein
MGEQLLDFTKNLLKIQQTREECDIFKIKGFNHETHQPEELDFLRDALISTKRVIKQGQKGRNIQSQSMYDAIVASYIELHDMIKNASGIEQG